MLVTIFTLQLSVPVQPRLVTVGRYDGRHPCLTCATAGGEAAGRMCGVIRAGRVFVHNPHGDRSQSSVAFLNINKNITSLAAGRLDTTRESDVLLVGTATDIVAYDVFANKDIFFKELPDGVFAMCVGRIGGIPSPLVFVGGNCSIQGLDATAQDRFWTVTGDNVCSLALCDVDGDDGAELVVGSEDFDLRVFHDDGEMIREMSHNEAVTSLCALSGRRFAFALANGTVGVYDGHKRLWTTTRKHQVISMHAFDCNLDGVPELVTGWSDGALEVRDPRTGNVLFSDTLPAMIAGVVQADYRLDGTETLIVCTVEGEVRGYQPMGTAEPRPDAMSPRQAFSPSAALSPAPDMDASFTNERQAAVLQAQRRTQELAQACNDLKMQLKTLETMQRTAGGRGAAVADVSITSAFAIVDGAAGTKPHLVLNVSAPLGLFLPLAVFSGEGLFATDKLVVHSASASNVISCPISTAKRQPVDIKVQAHICQHEEAWQRLVKDVTIQLPRFAGFRPISTTARGGKLSLAVPSQHFSKIFKWVNDNFLMPTPLTSLAGSVSFAAIDGDCQLTVSVEAELTIISSDPDVAGDVVQSLAEFLGIEDLNSLADYPTEAEDFCNLLTKVNEFHAARQRLSANLADNSNFIKGLVVRAEDSRIQGDMDTMKDTYMQLHDLNRDLFNAYNIRCNNHTELVACLKSVNTKIQRIGRWRVGKAKTNTINACREAIKNNDPTALVKTLKMGAPSSVGRDV